MIKKVGIIKRVTCLGLIFLLSINSFAAIVSDNDGSAFITKAEFDALKSSFQSQIDSYNQSIDSKIDGAIASYLSGLKLTTKEILPNLLPNYDKVMWVNNWNLYGDYKHFSCASLTAVDVNKSNVWFTPPCEARAVTRGHNQYFTCWGTSWGHVLAGAVMDLTATNKKIIDGGMGAYAENFAVQLNEGTKVVNNTTPFVNVRGCNNWTYANGISITGVDDNDWANQIGPTGVVSTYDDTAANKIMSFGIQIYRGTTSTKKTLNCYLRTDNVNFPTTYGAHDAFGTTSTSKTQCADTDDYGTLSYFKSNGGITYVGLSNTYKTQLVNLAKYMMFGVDISNKVNTFSPIEASRLRGNLCYETDSTNVVTANAKFSVVWAGNPFASGGITNHSASTLSGTINHTLTFPLMPQQQIAELSGGNLVANRETLKYGQGIPIVASLNRKGTVAIKITWDVEGILGTSITDKNIKIDLKDQDFSTTSGNYKKASIDNINGAKVEIKQKEFTQSSHQVTLYVDGNMGDNIWLRMQPSATDAGRCAKIKILEVTLLNEG